jgi:hypothetical protein
MAVVVAFVMMQIFGVIFYFSNQRIFLMTFTSSGERK